MSTSQPEDDDDVWGAPPQEEAPSLPDLPPDPKTLTDTPSKPPKSIVDLGPPPRDPLKAQGWAHRLLMLQAYETAMDEGIDQRTRRSEVRAILVAAGRFSDDTIVLALRKQLKAEKRELEGKRRTKNPVGAKLEARPAPGGAKILPIRRDV